MARRARNFYIDDEVYKAFVETIKVTGLGPSRTVEMWMRLVVLGKGNIVRGMTDVVMEQIHPRNKKGKYIK
jgi:hypothetical protein